MRKKTEFVSAIGMISKLVADDPGNVAHVPESELV